MLKFEDPEIPFEDRLQDEKFIVALKVFIGDKAYTIRLKELMECSRWYEDSLLRSIDLFDFYPEMVDYDLFFSNFKESVVAFNKYIIIKSRGIILKDI